MKTALLLTAPLVGSALATWGCHDPAKLLKTTFRHSSSALLFPDSPDYAAELGQYWNVLTQSTKPKVIVRPRNTAEAAKAIRTLGKNKCKFAVRSGGHTPHGYANNSPSVVVVTSKLNTLSYKSRDVLSIGPGNRWQRVYEKALERNQTLVGGRVLPVGVGGFFTGGGLSHFSNEYGWAVDMIQSAEVVLADGRVVTASKKSYADLFWAIKGGSNNFGLVTRFDVKTVPQPHKIWAGILTVSPEHLPKVWQALYTWQKKFQPKDPKAAVLMPVLRGPAVGLTDASLATIVLAYNAEVENPPTMAIFQDIPSLVSTVRLRTHLDLGFELSATELSGTNTRRHFFYTGSYKANAEMNALAHDIFMEEIGKTALFSDPTSVAAWSLQAISKSMLLKDVDGHSATLDPKGAPYIWYSMHLEWADEALDGLAQGICERAHKRIQHLSKKKGTYTPFLFLNDAGPGQNPIFSYGKKTVKRLREVSRRYDPRGVWQKQVGGYKLW